MAVERVVRRRRRLARNRRRVGGRRQLRAHRPAVLAVHRTHLHRPARDRAWALGGVRCLHPSRQSSPPPTRASAACSTSPSPPTRRSCCSAVTPTSPPPATSSTAPQRRPAQARPATRREPASPRCARRSPRRCAARNGVGLHGGSGRGHHRRLRRALHEPAADARAGHELLVPDPGWSNYPAMAHVLHATAVGYPLDPRRGIAPTPTPRPRSSPTAPARSS